MAHLKKALGSFSTELYITHLHYLNQWHFSLLQSTGMLPNDTKLLWLHLQKQGWILIRLNRKVGTVTVRDYIYTYYAMHR